MKLRTIWAAAILAVAAVAGSPEIARAQYPGGYIPGTQRPTISPYLDLLRPGNDGFAFRYLRRTRPELQLRQADAAARRSILNLQRQQQQTSQRVGGLQQSLTSQLSPTGHAAGFMTHQGYFGNR